MGVPSQAPCCPGSPRPEARLCPEPWASSTSPARRKPMWRRPVRSQASGPEAACPGHPAQRCSGQPPGLPAYPLGSQPCRRDLTGPPPGPGQVGCQQKPTRTLWNPWLALPITGPSLRRCPDSAGEAPAVPLDTALGSDQPTEPPGSGDYILLVQGPLPGRGAVAILTWTRPLPGRGTVAVLTWTRPASRYRSTKVLSLGTDWLSSRETTEKKAKWPGTTSSSRTRADVALISVGGGAVAERRPQCGGHVHFLPHASQSCCMSSPWVWPALLGAGVGATTRIEPQQQAGRLGGDATGCDGEVDADAPAEGQDPQQLPEAAVWARWDQGQGPLGTVLSSCARSSEAARDALSFRDRRLRASP